MTNITDYQIFYIEKDETVIHNFKTKMTITYTKQKLEMTTITQNKFGKVVPWGGGGANGEEMQSIILDNGEKEKAV